MPTELQRHLPAMARGAMVRLTLFPCYNISQGLMNGRESYSKVQSMARIPSYTRVFRPTSRRRMTTVSSFHGVGMLLFLHIWSKPSKVKQKVALAFRSVSMIGVITKRLAIGRICLEVPWRVAM